MGSIQIFNKMKKKPFGFKLFSKLVCFKAPYFGSVHPYIYKLESGTCQARMKKRRSVTNHLGTVHAIAMCNIAELCGGLAIDSCIPKELRWIPKGMSVKYLKKANTDLECIARIDPKSIVEGENIVEVLVKDTQEEIVFSARIEMYVSKRP